MALSTRHLGKIVVTPMEKGANLEIVNLGIDKLSVVGLIASKAA